MSPSVQARLRNQPSVPGGACAGRERIDASNTGSPCPAHFTRPVLTRGTALFTFTSVSLILTKAFSVPGGPRAAGGSSRPGRAPLGLDSSFLGSSACHHWGSLARLTFTPHLAVSWSSPFVLQFSASPLCPFFPFPPPRQESGLRPPTADTPLFLPPSILLLLLNGSGSRQPLAAPLLFRSLSQMNLSKDGGDTRFPRLWDVRQEESGQSA